MVIFPSVLLCILLVDAFTKGVNEGIPSQKILVCLWPIQLIYALPRIVGAYLVTMPMMAFTHLWMFPIGILLYLLSFGIKYLFRKSAYGITPHI